MIYLLREQREQWTRRKELKVPDKVALKDDCIEASRMLLSFVNERIVDAYGNSFERAKGMNGNFFSLMKSHDIPDLIRYVHMAGYRIELVKVSEHDVESPSTTEERLNKYHVELKTAERNRIEKELGF
ncbi:MAG: hypothetical protein IJY59_01870 [Bacteroidaceae bacterium]|nr:hypothetical protein [Bacteroidaceae bacterium]